MAYVAFETEEEQSAYWRLMSSLLGDDEDDSPADERGFCPTGEGGGIDNSCGGKGGGGKSGSTGGRKGGRKKPDRVPTKRPSKAERALAASDGTSDKHVAARKVVAAHYMHSQGAYLDRRTGELKPLDEDRFRGQMKAIDWTKPVTAGPPPSMPPPREFVQWQTPGLIPPTGGYFSTPGTEPERLGIGSKGTLWTDPALPTLDKVPHLFSVAGAPGYLRSTAAPAVDTWSQKGVIQRASGGGPQWFVPEAQAKGGVKQLKLKGARPRRSVRAFCPGASPPDNSCSPSNKSDGKSGGTKSGKTPQTPKKSPAEKQMDMMREYMERFDGSSLSRPRVIMGMPDFHVNPVEFSKYLEAQGQEWQGAALPKFVQRGKMGDCYQNATRLVLNNPELDYVEGVAYPSGMSGMGFLHGWAVERRTGRVIDNTWDKPEDCKYFGVRYERKEYMRHVARTKYYGVVGGDPKAAARVIKKGKL